MEKTKVIFNGLGPGNVFHYDGINYKDGMSAELPVDIAMCAVQSKYAIPYTEKSEDKVAKLVEVNDKKRDEIATKVQNQTQGGK